LERAFGRSRAPDEHRAAGVVQDASETLPVRMALASPQPRLPATIRSASGSSAACTISSAGEPFLTSVSTRGASPSSFAAASSTASRPKL